MPIKTLMKLPPKARALWESTYKAAKEQYGEERAGKIAWASVKKKFKKVDEKWVAKFEERMEFETTRYEFDASDESVSKDSDGVIYKDYVLSSQATDSHGYSFSDFALKRMVEQINQEGLVGRIDGHELFRKTAEDKLPEDIEDELQDIDTGLKAIKARYENGKVIATIKMAPEAYAVAKEYVGASVEARIPKSAIRGGVYHQARLVGFSLVNNPANPEAVASQS